MMSKAAVFSVPGAEIIEETEIQLKRSKSGEGLNIRLAGGGVLSVSVKSVKKLIDGHIKETRFTKYPGSCEIGSEKQEE